MEKRGFVVAALVALLLGVMAVPGLAQQPGQAAGARPDAESIEEEVQLTRVAIQMERQALVTRAMDLTPQEMEGFWPVYRDYRMEMFKLGDRLADLIVDYSANYLALTDEVADRLLMDFVSIEQERAQIRSKYVPKFKVVLPAKKVARFYQIENKLDISILTEMAKMIPLAR
jgi:hypothetical protein